MKLMLSPFAKTVPTNHKIEGIELYDPLADVPGGTLTEEAWAKATRQADPNYDWGGYEYSTKRPLFDHPQFANRETDVGLMTQHNDLLHELGRRPEVKEEFDE